ncbi:MAG: hypothetical protein VX642_10535 [Bdellovibrionota bacterium]|nr:hypothetical protein [Bdellovibrionota bacterium]
MFKCKIRKQLRQKNVKVYVTNLGSLKAGKCKRVELKRCTRSIHLDWYWVGDASVIQQLFNT